MRKRMWGAIAGVAAGAGAAGAQSPPGNPPAPGAIAPAGEVVQVQDVAPPGVGLPPGFGAAPGARHMPPTIMPPVAPGPAGDPQGFGPMGGFGPPPGPMYPPPGPYGAQMAQPGVGGGLGAATAPHYWSSFEYIMWYSKSQSYDFPLLTTSAPADAGLPSRASTFALAGNGTVSANPLSGGRVTVGFFGDIDRRYGFEASGFVTDQRANIVDVATSPAGIPILARPFRDSATPTVISTLVVGGPSIGQAQTTVFNGLQAFSVEANGLVNLYRSEPGCATGWSLDFLAGYRYLEVDERFRETSVTNVSLPSVTTPVFTTGAFGVVTQTGTTTTVGTLNAAGLSIPSGSRITVDDQFRTRNQFNGGQVGLRGEFRRGMFLLNTTGKLAFGHMHQVFEITGYTDIARGSAAVAAGGTPVTGRAVGGILANGANIGRYNHDEFALIPELTANLGVAVTPNFTLWAGYNFLYIDHLVRPAANLSNTVNSATIPLSPNYGAANRPRVAGVTFNQDDFWLMGFNTGFTIRF